MEIVQTGQSADTEGRSYIVEYYCFIPDDMRIIGNNINGIITIIG